MEIKQGDKVRILDNVPEIYTQTIFSVHIPMEMEVVKVQDGSARIRPILSGLSGLSFEYIIPCKYLVKVDADAKEPKHIFYGDYAKRASESLEKLKRKTHPEWYSSTEPTEQTETETKPYDGISEETANEMSNMLETYTKALSGIADSFNWQRYEADLAKEVAVKVANKFNAPHEAAEYAVSVAKAVVKNLKKK